MVHDPSGITHVASNMIFLLAFGRVVEGRLGHLGFATLYLVGGALAGLLQIALTKGTVIGASGSVSVVAGAFLALHPRGSVQPRQARPADPLAHVSPRPRPRQCQR